MFFLILSYKKKARRPGLCQALFAEELHGLAGGGDEKGKSCWLSIVSLSLFSRFSQRLVMFLQNISDTLMHSVLHHHGAGGKAWLLWVGVEPMLRFPSCLC